MYNEFTFLILDGIQYLQDIIVNLFVILRFGLCTSFTIISYWIDTVENTLQCK